MHAAVAVSLRRRDGDEGAAGVRSRADSRLPTDASARRAAAELMIPKWFDKKPAQSQRDNIDDLRAALRARARGVHVGARCAHRVRPFRGALPRRLLRTAAHARAATPLVSPYRRRADRRAARRAVPGAASRSLEAVRSNLIALAASLAPDLADASTSTPFLRAPERPRRSPRGTRSGLPIRSTGRRRRRAGRRPAGLAR